MKTALVTGASGFVGTPVVDQLLERGWRVHALSRGPATPAAQSAASRAAQPAAPHSASTAVTWHACDLLSADPGEMRRLMSSIRASHWIHLAWCTEPGVYWRSPENLRWARATQELMQAFREQGGERAVMAGTCAEYDPDFGYCREASTPLRPSTPYGAAKHALQVLAGAFAATSGLSVAWGRLFFLYGPGERPERLVPSVIRALLAGEPAPCTQGDQVRDYLHVEDAAAAFVALLESGHQGPANVAAGVPVRIRDLVVLIASQIGRPDLLRLGALPSPPAEAPMLAGDPAVLHGLGWRPRHELDAGIAQTIAWWRNRGG